MKEGEVKYYLDFLIYGEPFKGVIHLIPDVPAAWETLRKNRGFEGKNFTYVRREAFLNPNKFVSDYKENLSFSGLDVKSIFYFFSPPMASIEVLVEDEDVLRENLDFVDYYGAKTRSLEDVFEAALRQSLTNTFKEHTQRNF
ncbi:hypothetical protein GOV05_04880 [Candidatus Woesearchaeota archaeon]|nr:hypothetical protein [Candidatus Woesearchaeota archaeon]